MPVAVDPYFTDVARFFSRYTRQYHAGAFAHPTASELAVGAIRIDDARDNTGGRSVVLSKRIGRESWRTDFTGKKFCLPPGSIVADHVARVGGALPRHPEQYDFIQVYAEDRELSLVLREIGFGVYASRVTSAAEVINVWARSGQWYRYRPYDVATVTDMGEDIEPALLDVLRDELALVDGWDDDFPYYSDGGWSAVCLKGFWPDEPGRGVKPTEMPKSWKAKHPADLGRRAQWTSLSAALVTTRQFIESIPWIDQTERIRLLRMKAGSKLGRHTDITDRDGGTDDGQITRFHVPLITHPGAKMTTWLLDGTSPATHLEAGRCYYLDARKPHAVHNDSPVDRIHLVIDVVTNEAVREQIALRENAA